MPTKTTASPSASPPRHHVNVRGQLLKYIPRRIVDAAAREFGVDKKVRTHEILANYLVFCIYFAFCSAAVRLYPTRRGLLQNRNRGREGDWDVWWAQWGGTNEATSN